MTDTWKKEKNSENRKFQINFDKAYAFNKLKQQQHKKG